LIKTVDLCLPVCTGYLLSMKLLKLHCVSKNVPPLTCYNLDIHDPITILFVRSVTEKVRDQKMLCFSPHLSSVSTLPCERENPEDSTLVLCACNTVQLLQLALDFLSPEPCPPTTPSWMHWLQV